MLLAKVEGKRFGVAESKYESGDRLKGAGAIQPHRHRARFEIMYYQSNG
jgi:hypothetical protein